ncbi:Linear gramicidin synthase subunit B [Nonomuraea coxensis DSM 45129]|uniref:Linear gramicidin synthase subunit B n=1 Tax=Nonomuraea coxensis DSM 45129 TaxID=1122611 RepID=A0ABX8U391_9ACTN|nr:phosphopantetheine-binding protein [Nonomuraea coxensis]QYC41604.1 Linear gramicidin synthase subunit B [Nonomuraea coxensis DSM 45129]
MSTTYDAVYAALAEDWKELLDVERVGPGDDFFELGGHSLVAIQVVARLRRRHGVEVPVAEVFARPTPAELAAAVCELLEAGDDRRSA